MPAVTRKQYKGAAAQTTITNALGAGDTTITIAANTGWPSAAGVPFFVVISPGTSSEEKCLATISGTTLTLTRAQDDTSAQSHSSGATIYPVFAADDADEANKLASTLTTRGDLLTMGAGPDFARVGIGAADTVLKSDGTDVSYGTIVAANIASDAVTTAKILNANVTGAKLANAEINDQTDDYTLVVGDRNKRVIMNKATANTVTVDDSIFAAGDTIFIANKGAGTSTITAGAGVTINTSGSLALAQYGGGTLIALSASTFTFFPAGGIGYGTATGGTSSSITVGGEAYTLLTFTSSGTLTVTKAGLFDVMLVGGGGGGGSSFSAANGGGGGGGLRIQTVYFDANATVTVGGGGAGAQGTGGLRGSPSAIGSQSNGVSVGGGGGGAGANTGAQCSGASGGGGVHVNPGFSSTDTFTGFDGGSANGTTGGGGGGASEAGNTDGQGHGGDGFDASAFRGESAATTLYGGGGAGGNGGTAGSGGGGAPATAGGTNTGGGGGGSANSVNNGGNGGSGIVLVRFKV